MNDAFPRMAAVLGRQRRAFQQAPYPSLAERRARLHDLRQALRRYQDRIAAAISADFGNRSITESKLADVLGPVLQINHARGHLRRWMKARRRGTELLFASNRAWVMPQPKGVVGVIAPWNFPVYLSVGPLIAALAAGNRVMIKMSELVPHTSAVLAELLAECFSEDEVAVFGGDVDAARAFSSLPFDHLVFTGAPAVGREVMAAASANLTPVTLELGGKSPAIVSRSASMPRAAGRIVHGKAFNSGQICVSPDYALVPRENVEAFVAAVTQAFRKMYPQTGGNPDYTSIVCARHAERVRGLLADAAAKGAGVLACAADTGGRQIPLHVVTGVDEGMRIAGEELFGPILPVIPYDSMDDALAYVNARPRPLALYYFGVDAVEMKRLTTATHSGGVTINDWGWHVFQHDLPFGGIGNSGMGSYHGEEGFRELSHAKSIFREHRFFPAGLFHPPYGRLVQRLAMKFYLGAADPALANTGDLIAGRPKPR